MLYIPMGVCALRPRPAIAVVGVCAEGGVGGHDSLIDGS